MLDLPGFVPATKASLNFQGRGHLEFVHLSTYIIVSQTVIPGSPVSESPGMPMKKADIGPPTNSELLAMVLKTVHSIAGFSSRLTKGTN